MSTEFGPETGRCGHCPWPAAIQAQPRPRRGESHSSKLDPRSKSTRPRKPRGKGLRSRAGCTTCKQRRIKCTQEQPQCHNCLRSSRPCSYPSALASCRAGRGGDAACSSSSDPLSAQHGTAAPLSVEPPPASQSGSLNDASRQWFGLLLQDQARDPRAAPLFHTSPSAATSITANAASLPPHATASAPPGHALQKPAVLHFAWQSDTPIELSRRQCQLFQHFVLETSKLLDFMDPHVSYATTVAHLALRNQGLLKAVLALSSRHMSLHTNITEQTETLSVQYYHDCLQYLQQAMKDIAFIHSQELIATTIIISTYEMLQGRGRGWERHLQGVFWIQRAADTDGESGGLKEASWWAWIRQDIWAAFREKRPIFSFWMAKKPVAALGAFEYARRAVWLLGRAVNYASLSPVQKGEQDPAVRMATGRQLLDMLAEYHNGLPDAFKALPLDAAAAASTARSSWPPIWIHPPAFAAAYQLYCFAKMLVLVNKAPEPGADGFLKLQGELNACIHAICGIASTHHGRDFCMSSVQCLFAAGLCMQAADEREELMTLLSETQRKAGWPMNSLSNELQSRWSATGHGS